MLCSQRHWKYGVKHKMPVKLPTMSLAAADLKNEWWPQSWNKMNRRTMNPPVKIASGKASQIETFCRKYIAHHNATNGMRVFTICQPPRQFEGRWYLATICFQAAGSHGDRSFEAESFINIFRAVCQQTPGFEGKRPHL